MINCQNLSNINETFEQVTKNAFDQMPNLTEIFDQLKRSSEIRSTDPLSKNLVVKYTKFKYVKKLLHNELKKYHDLSNLEN